MFKKGLPTPGDDMRWPTDRNRNNANKEDVIPAFLPGQRGLLAQQLNRGFGGGQKQWRGVLSDVYAPMAVTPFDYGAGAADAADAGSGDVTPPTGLSPFDLQMADRYQRAVDKGNQGLAQALWSHFPVPLRTYIMQQRQGGK